MKVEILQSDIDAAVKAREQTRRTIQFCPVAQALKRMFPQLADTIEVGYTFAKIDGRSYDLSEEAQHVTYTSRENWHEVEPTSFELRSRE
jgi:hypothetical protein